MKNTILILLASVSVLFGQTAYQRNVFTTNGTAGAMAPVILASNSLHTGDQSVNTSLENWPRMLHRGTNATMLGLGDSTGLYTLSYLRNPIFHHLGSNGFGVGSMFPLHLAGAYTNNGSASDTNWPGAYYTVGTNSSAGAGEITSTNWSGTLNGGTWCDTFTAIVQRSPTGGAVMWQTSSNGSAWTTRAILNTSGSYGVVATNIVLSAGLGWYRTRLIYSNGGPTVVYGLQAYDSTVNGRGARFHDMTYAGSRIGQLTNIATNILGPSLAKLHPAVVFLEHRDSSNEYVNALPAVRSLFTNWIPDADIVIVGVGPKGTDDWELVGQNAVAREWCRTNGWTYLDMRALPNFATYFTVTNFYGYADSGDTHYPGAAQQAQGDSAMARLDLLNNTAIAGNYVESFAPQGRRFVSKSATSNDFSGDLGVAGLISAGNNLHVTGQGIYSGASAGLALQDRADSADNSRNWYVYNSGRVLGYYFGTANMFEMESQGGSVRFSSIAAQAHYTKLGDATRYWRHGWFDGMTSTNSTNYGNIQAAGSLTVSGNQTNVGAIYAGQARFDMSGLHSIAITNQAGNNPRLAFQYAGATRSSIDGGMGSGYDLEFRANNAHTLTIQPNLLRIRTNAQNDTFTVWKSNTVTAAAVAAAITNGDFGSIVISNGLHHFWMSNNVMGWKLAAP